MSVLTKFELRKIIGRKSAAAAVIVLLVFFGFILLPQAWSMFSYTDSGEEVDGLASIPVERKAVHATAGPLTTQKISELIREYQKLYSDPKNRTQKNDLTDAAFAKWHKYFNIQWLIGKAYSPATDFDGDIIQKLSPEDGSGFYAKRMEGVASYLDLFFPAGAYTEAQKTELLAMNGRISVPFYYDYTDGWYSLLRVAAGLSIVITLAVCVCISPVFASEYETGSDSILLTAKYGRNRVIRAKLKASFLFSTGLYFGAALFYLLIHTCVYGVYGWNCPIQAQVPYWFSPYPVTFLQACLVSVLLGYLACMAVTAATLFLSARLKTSFAAIIFTAGLFLFPFAVDAKKLPRALGCLWYLFPIKIMDGDGVFRGNQLYELYDILGHLVLQPWVMAGAALIFSAVFSFAAYRAFQRHQAA